MSDRALSWLEVLGTSGVIALIGRAGEGAFRWFIRRPLQTEEARRQRAEREADDMRRRYLEIAAELKATTGAIESLKRATEIAAGAAPDSLPPPRAELPTLTCFVEGPGLRAWAEEQERARAAPLNPSREGRRPPPLEGVRVIETYSPTARPTKPAPPGASPERPASLAPPFPPPARLPRPRPR